MTTSLEQWAIEHGLAPRQAVLDFGTASCALDLEDVPRGEPPAPRAIGVEPFHHPPAVLHINRDHGPQIHLAYPSLEPAGAEALERRAARLRWLADPEVV